MPVKLTDKEFRDKVYEAHQGKIIPLEAYPGSKKPIRFLCNNCGESGEVKKSQMLMRILNPCKNCGQHRYSEEEIKSKLLNYKNGKFKLVEYGGTTHKKSILLCTECNRKFETSIHSFIGQESDCPYTRYERSGNSNKQPLEIFLDRLEKETEGEFEYIEGYTKIRGKALIKHKKCGNIYSVDCGSLLRKRTCPFCSKSKGETIIKNYLESLGLDFRMEYSFNNLRNKDGTKKLRFDFAIFKEGNTYLIEFDGSQHFSPKFRSSSEQYEYLKSRDLKKSMYCLYYEIPLLRIKFSRMSDYNKVKLLYEKQVKDFLSVYNLIP